MTPFLILSLPRSGTQLLTAHLNQHPDIHAHGEILNQIDPDTTTADIMWRCWMHNPDSKAALGATILHEQLTPRPLLLNNLLAIHNMHIIVLERANQLERIRSAVQAATMWDWSIDHPPQPKPAIELHPGKTLRELKTALLWHRELCTITNPVLWLYYEQLAEAPATTLTPVWEFLHLTNPGPTLDTGTWKQEPRPLSDTVDNWDEIATMLAGTRWEQ